ncbi:MAG: hypothetical protein AB4038_14160 [Prochloraceae cyanobacterium]
MNLTAPESITFEEALAFTQSLLEQIEAGKLNEEEIQEAIASLVKSMNGARGFFVTYLTDDRTLADNPSNGVIQALQSSPEIVGELLVKNVAMSTAMAITHRRNNDEKMAKSSDRVSQRTANLIKQFQLNIVVDKLQQLCQSAATGQGNYQDFLQRWGYDEEQRQAIEQVISQLNSELVSR